MNKYSHRDNILHVSSSQRSISGYKSANLKEDSPLKILTQRTKSRMSFCESNFDKLSMASSMLGEIGYRSPSSELIPIHLKRAGSISKFTMQQNEIISSSLNKFSWEKKKKTSSLPEIELIKFTHKDNDYLKLINKLNQVISPNGNKRPVFFQDSDPVDFSMDENQIQFCKISVRGKKTPMIVKIQRFRGKVMTYLSTIYNEPGPSNYERYFGTDFFEIRENSTYFKYDNIFLGIKAIEDSIFKVTVAFGKITSLLELKRIRRQLSLRYNFKESLIEDEEEEEIHHHVEKKQKSPKNFIAMNKGLKILSSCLNGQVIKEKAEQWKMRRTKVLEKKKILSSEKKNRVKDLLNKKILKIQMEKAEKERLLQLQTQQLFEKIWLKFIFFFLYSEKIYDLIKVRKRIKIKKLTWNFSACKIQKKLKGLIRSASINDMHLTRVNNLLCFYHNNMFGVMKKFSCSNCVFEVISSTAHSYSVRHQFNNFLIKSLYIQKSIRKYLSKRKQRIAQLNCIWNENSQLYLFRRGSKKNTRKKQSLNLITLSSSKKNFLISEYYHSCVIKYTEIIRAYLKSLRSLNSTKGVASAAAILCNLTLPPFEYLPTPEKLEELIEISLKKI